MFNWDVASQAGVAGEDAPYLLWNFGDTAELMLTGGDTVEGSIYAPNADFTDLAMSNVEGQIVAKSAVLGTTVANSGEVHHYPFAAQVSCETDVDPTPSESPTSDGPTSDTPISDGPTSEGPTSNGQSHGGTTGMDAAGGGDSFPGGLPVTGASLTVPAILAGALLAVGAVVIFAARRRRNLD